MGARASNVGGSPWNWPRLPRASQDSHLPGIPGRAEVAPIPPAVYPLQPAPRSVAWVSRRIGAVRRGANTQHQNRGRVECIEVVVDDLTICVLDVLARIFAVRGVDIVYIVHRGQARGVPLSPAPNRSNVDVVEDRVAVIARCDALEEPLMLGQIDRVCSVYRARRYRQSTHRSPPSAPR